MKTFRNMVIGVLIGSAATFGIAQNVASEKANHPRIAAVTSIDDAVAYMEAAPHDFGGHKAHRVVQSGRPRPETCPGLSGQSGSQQVI
jgi:hypothetical protein